MENIIQNVHNPEWWFSGLFFLILSLIVTKAVDSWIPKVWEKLTFYVPVIKKGLVRKTRLKRINELRKNRTSHLFITWLIGRFFILCLLSILYFCFILIYFLLLKEYSFKGEIAMVILMLLPGYGALALLIVEKKRLFALIKEHDKLKKYERKLSNRFVYEK